MTMKMRIFMESMMMRTRMMGMMWACVKKIMMMVMVMVLTFTWVIISVLPLTRSSPYKVGGNSIWMTIYIL